MTTPRTVPAASTGFRVTADLPMTVDPRMSPRDLWSMALAAAGMTMRGKGYTPDDRADCAASICADIMGMANRHPAPRPYTLGTFPLTREASIMAALMDRDMSRPATAMVRRAEDVFYIPPSVRTFTRMVNRAATLRRSLDRSRARDDAEANAPSAEGFTVTPDYTAIRPVSPTPEAAHAAARDMLDALGLPRLGKAYPLAYAAARIYSAREAHRAADGRATGHAVTAVRDTDVAHAAADLGYRSPEALTTAANRAAAKIPARSAGDKETVVYRADGSPTVVRRARYDAAAFGSALGLEAEAAPARKASATRMHSADMGDRHHGWRGKEAPLPPAAPVTVRYMGTDVDPAAYAPSADRAQCIAEDGTLAPPAWTRDLTAAQRARLGGGARVKRERMDAKTPEQRAADRAAAGLPATVR